MYEKRPIGDEVGPYSLGVTVGELKSYCKLIADKFREETGIVVGYEPVDDMPLSTGKTGTEPEGGGFVHLGMNGITRVDPNENEVYDVASDGDALVPDRNVACCLMTLEHELQHVRQNYGEWTRDPEGRAPEYILWSHLAFSYNLEFYLQSHLRNIRETDADMAGFLEGLGDLAELRPGYDTDSVMLEYVNSRWDHHRVYRIGKRGMEFKSVQEVEDAFGQAMNSFMTESPRENPYGFHDTVALWMDRESHLAMAVRPLDRPDPKHPDKMISMAVSRGRWHDVFDSIQNSKTRAEFDRKAASVMLYIHSEYKDEFNLDGIDLSPKAVFGIDKFPESSAFVRDRLGLEKKPFWVVRTQAFKDGVSSSEDGLDPEEDLVPVDPLDSSGQPSDLSREERRVKLEVCARRDTYRQVRQLDGFEQRDYGKIEMRSSGLPDFSKMWSDKGHSADDIER